MDDYTCPLCQTDGYMKWYYECRLFWIARCAVCNDPIIVFTEHTKDVDQSLINEALHTCKTIFDLRKYRADFNMSEVIGHKHFHLRPIVSGETTTDNMVD